MAVPGRVESILADDESIRTRVALGDDAVLYVTPTRVITYRESSLLRDESLTSVSADIERLSFNKGRRSVTFTFEHGLRDPQQLSIPANTLEDALPAILEGVLVAGGVLAADERVTGTFTFSELTIVTTDQRLLKHVGSALWATDYEAFTYEDVTGLFTEEGSVATGIVLELGSSGIERFKVPNEAARRVTHELESSICAYHEIASLDDLHEDEPEDVDDEQAENQLDALMDADASQFHVAETQRSHADIEERLDALRDAIEYHEELLERHRELLDRLEAQLTRDR